MKFKLVCGLSAAAVMALTGCSHGGSSSGPIATVGKAEITQKEFYDYLQRKPKFITNIQGHTVPVQVTNSPGFQAMQDLIEDKLVEEVAKEEGVYPSDSEVQAELQLQLKQDPHLVDKALSAGYSMEELKGEYKEALCRFKVQTKGITVTPAEVDDFIKNNPKALLEPPRVQALFIFVKKSDKTNGVKKQVDDAIRSGSPFTTVAQSYSDDPNGAKNQFRYPVNDETQMAPALRKLFDNTPELKTTDWQPIGKTGGFIKFYIEKKVPAKPITMTDYLRERIKRSLMMQKGQKAGINLDKMIADKIQADKDSIKINIKQDEAPWKEFTAQVGEKLAAVKDAPPALGGAMPGATPSGDVPAGGQPAGPGATTKKAPGTK